MFENGVRERAVRLSSIVVCSRTLFFFLSKTPPSYFIFQFEHYIHSKRIVHGFSFSRVKAYMRYCDFYRYLCEICGLTTTTTLP